MIIGDPLTIAVQLEYLYKPLHSPEGTFNFILNQNFIPAKGVMIDIYIVLNYLKENSLFNISKIKNDIGNIELDEIDFSDERAPDLASISVGELSDYGCFFYLGYHENEERFIYTIDYEKSYQEIRFPKGTIENLIKTLPNAEDLKIKKVKDNIYITEIK